MRRTLNVKLLAGLLVATAVLGGGVHLVHGFQEKRNAGDLLRRADQAERKGDLEQDQKYLSRYLAFRPDDDDALARYALLLDKRDTSGKNRVRVLLALEESLRRADDADDALRRNVRRRIAELAMSPELGRYRDAEENLRRLLKSSPDDGELERLLGECLEAEGQTGKSSDAEARYQLARTWYEKAIAHAPNHLDAYTRLSGLLRARFRDPAEANRTMDRMIAGDPRVSRPRRVQAQAHLARARYRTENHLPGVDEDVKEAQGLAPDEADVLVAAVELARSKNDPDGARKLAERGIGLHPKDMRMYQMLAAVESQSGQPQEAVKALDRGLAALPGRENLQWNRAQLLIQSRRTEEAREAVAQLRKRDDIFQPTVDFLEARLLLIEGRRAEAVSLLEHARALLANVPGLADLTNQADLLLAVNYEQLGNPERELAASRRVLDRDSRSLPAMLGQATALLALGRTDEAIAAYHATVPAYPAAWVSVLQLLIARNLGWPDEKRDWKTVDQALDEAEKATPNSLEVMVLRAQALVARGRLEQARDLLQQAREKHPEQVGPWIALADLAGRQGKPEAILAVLDEARRQLGDRVELRLARAGYWGRRGGEGAHIALEEMTRDLDRFTGDGRLRLEDGLAGAFARLGSPADRREAERLWTRVADQRPDDLRIAARLFDLLYQAGDLQADDAGLQRAIDRLRRIEGEDGALWRYGEAARLTLLARRGDPKRLDEARLILIEVAKRRPEWSRVPLLEAEIAELQGDPERAVGSYQQAIERGEKNPSVVRRTVELLNARGRTAEADRVVRKMLEQAPPSGTLGQLAAEMALRHQDQEQSLELASRAVPPDSKDYRDHLWLAQISWAAGRRAEAGEALRHAVTLGGDAPETWITYINYLVRTDAKDRPPILKETKAEEAIQEAQRKLSPERAPLVLAHGYTVTGQTDRAEQQYQAALAAKPDDVALLQALARFYTSTNQGSKAEAYLQRILDPRTRASESQMAWARRQQALILAARGGYPKIQEALALVDRNLRVQGDSVEDQRLKALLLGMLPGGQREAIRAFEDLARHSPPTPEEKFLLAQFYAALHNPAKAGELLLSALASQEENPLYLASFTRNLLIRNHFDEAQTWLAKLEALQPQNPQTVELKARLLAARGKGTEAAAVLKAYAQGKDANVGLVAALLEELGQTAAAEEMYCKYSSDPGHPERILARANFLARQQRSQESLDLCEQAWQSCPPELVGSTCVSVVSKAGGNEEQYRRVGRWLDRAIRAKPASSSLSFSLAYLRIYQGDYEDAERILRQIAGSDATKGAPLNNLAVILALQGGRGSEALELINRAIALEGTVPALRHTRALAYLATGQGDLAIKDLEEAITASPTAEMYVDLARAFVAVGRRDDARKAFQDAKNSGFKVEDLHPLQRKVYDQLRDELARR